MCAPIKFRCCDGIASESDLAALRAGKGGSGGGRSGGGGGRLLAASVAGGRKGTAVFTGQSLTACLQSRAMCAKGRHAGKLASQTSTLCHLGRHITTTSLSLAANMRQNCNCCCSKSVSCSSSFSHWLAAAGLLRSMTSGSSDIGHRMSQLLYMPARSRLRCLAQSSFLVPCKNGLDL